MISLHAMLSEHDLRLSLYSITSFISHHLALSLLLLNMSANRTRLSILFGQMKSAKDLLSSILNLFCV